MTPALEGGCQFERLRLHGRIDGRCCRSGVPDNNDVFLLRHADNIEGCTGYRKMIICEEEFVADSSAQISACLADLRPFGQDVEIVNRDTAALNSRP